VSLDRLDLAFLVPGLPFTGDTLTKTGLGGSETAGLCLARALAAMGHHVGMFCNCDTPGTYDGVLYRPLADFGDYATSAPHDVTIVQRAPEIFAARMNSRLNILWCHDLAVGRRGDVFRTALWNVDKIAVLSEYMAGQYKDVYGVPDDVLWRTRNGIDLSLFQRPAAAQRDRHRLVFGARPERGLDVLLDRIFPTLLMKRPMLTLSIATYGNNVRHLLPFYEQCVGRAREFGPRVTMLPPLSKAEYYDTLLGAGVYVYPTPSPTAPAFAEISCITLMECMAAGLPVVSSRRGALPETLAPGAGVLIDGNPASDEYLEAFVDAVLRYVRDDDAWQAASDAGRQHAAGLDWAAVAEQWTEELTRFIVERNDSPSRLVRHLMRRSDIIAARQVVGAHLAGDAPAWATAAKAEIDAGWAFAESASGLQDQYEKVGQTHTDVFFGVPGEGRFQLLEQWMREHPQVARVLDYGCAHGSYTVNLANRVGREWVGVDIDKHSIRWAEHNRVERCTTPESVQFRVGTHEVDLSDQAPFDALVAFEVLEHVPDPTAVLDQLERWVEPDGYVLITVPYGPWEWMSYETYPHRCHLWEFDLHDLRDLFGKKKDLKISAMAAGPCQPLNEALGWHVIEYRVDGTPTGQIDMARKLRLQRPRQTVSAVLIGGPTTEATLAWALAPIRQLVDELIVGDCGLSDRARAICAEHKALVVPAADPLAHGFEAPRNDALAHATMDWVLWFDTDERLVGGEALNKYLRENIFNGYNIRQHNFSCDAPHEATLPVRCFRRRPREDGQAMRWVGMIHEHPEFGLNEGPGRTIILRDVHLAHLGYLTGEDQVARFHRNLPLLLRDREVYPDRKLQKHFLCRDHIQLAKWAAQKSQGVITAEIEAHCREVLRIYREHFLGKGTYLNADSLQYYSTALRMLGEGVEVAWVVGAAKDEGVAVGEPMRVRFASIEEAEAEILFAVRETMKPYVSPWW
jgi:glycosyltransferase involved in cell wall biosynthesis/SAM-dependent methyltransferase